MLKSWLNGSRMLPPWLALAILIGIQLALWWLMASVLRELSARTVNHVGKP